MSMISRRKFMAVAGATAVVSALAACGSSSSSTSTAASTGSSSAAGSEAGTKALSYVALCCDTGTIDDESFNQACWEALRTASTTSPRQTLPMRTARPSSARLSTTALRLSSASAICTALLWLGLPSSTPTPSSSLWT